MPVEIITPKFTLSCYVFRATRVKWNGAAYVNEQKSISVDAACVSCQQLQTFFI